MQDLGYSVLILCVEGTPVHQRATEMELPVQLIRYHRKYYDVGAAKELRKILQNANVTHLIVRATRDLSIAANVGRKMGSALHVSYFMEMQMGVKKTHFLHTLRYRQIDLWSCPLPYLAEQVRTMTHFRNQLVIIPSGIELAPFEKDKNPEACRELLNLPQDRFLFGLIGRFDPQKGQMLVLQALKQAEDLPCDLVFLGEPTVGEAEAYYQELLQIIEENGWKQRVHLRPYRKDTATFYHAIDALIMATKAESIGMVTIETLACGIPVIGSNKGGTPEILQEGKAGILFESEDATDLARALRSMMEELASFKAEDLRAAVQANDHLTVCRQVEAALGLQK